MHVETATSFHDRFHLGLHGGEVIAALRYLEKLPYVLPVSGCDKGSYLKRARVSLLFGVRSHRSVIDLEAITYPPVSACKLKVDISSATLGGAALTVGQNPIIVSPGGHSPWSATSYLTVVP